MAPNLKDCRVAAFEREGVAAAVDEETNTVDEEADTEDDFAKLGPEGDEDGVVVEAGVNAGMIPESVKVETGLGRSESTEDGTGIVDVSCGTGESNEPFI
jgi:hypothetical protein